ncbi:hypothetical protein PF005_g19929 [Phytophthora fragariae]|uniref:Uncharacterized protein n=3 Tax=Phytophthora TaxID=4783 RepID=A0A6A3IGI7_9STRA|nr:hypothetical protein PF011_g22924 [Phytophthora fragariae]KAE9094826.1 hypothetical protein PF006_g24133 [Phytophthora fragariae]KAE9188752.1 hypothetical protein PF005_g19929 [Phytophthora fragariae]
MGSVGKGVPQRRRESIGKGKRTSMGSVGKGVPQRRRESIGKGKRDSVRVAQRPRE